MSPSNKKLILVIGATGAQGIAVINGLLEPCADGSPSPYAIRAFTRDPESSRAKTLAERGCEIAQGSFDDYPSVSAALQGVYGAWVNTDGFTVGEAKEIHAGMRIFELAKMAKTVRHYVWSNLDYVTKKSGYNPMYCCQHSDGKGRVGEWLKAQPTIVNDYEMSWSAVTTSPYMDMLKAMMFGPLNRRADGTYVFATPVGHGPLPMIALKDIGYFARYTFDHREETSGQDLEVTSELVNWEYLVATFTKVTGKPAVVLHQSLDEWFANFTNVDAPLANERHGLENDGSWTWRENFTCWWSMLRDGIVQRDMEWIRSIHPNVLTLERWMRDNNYTGELDRGTLKNAEDGKSIGVNFEKVASL